MPTAVTRFLCALLLAAATPEARAGAWIWTGTGGNSNWNTGGNWNLGTVPASASITDLTFAGNTNTGTALVPLNQNIATPFQLDKLTFSGTAGTFFLGGNALAFTGTTNSIAQSSANAQSIANGIAASVNSTVTLTLGGAGTGVATLSGNITAGSGNRDYAITKSSTSTFVLSGTNTYGGATTINGGVINIQNASALGSISSGTSVASGAALQIQGNIAVGAEALTLNGSGVSSNGALRNISGTNSYAGAITFGSASTISSDAGTLTLSGNVNNGGFLFTESGAGNVTITSVISGSGGLLKTGTGTLTLSGATANTYTGTTTVSQGTLILAKPGLVLAPAITIGGAGSTATVQINVDFQLYGAATTINSQGVLDLNNHQEYVGALTVSGGSILTGTGLLYIGGGITSNASSVTTTLAGNYSLYTNQIFNVASGTTGSGQDVVISGAVAEYLAGTTITKQGNGTLVLSGANSFTGLMTVSSGVLNIQNASALGTTAGGTTVSSGAALQLQGGISVGNEALTLNGGGVSSDGALRNISGNNSYAGTITQASGSRIYSDASTLTLSGGIVTAGYTLTFGGSGNLAETGIISGTGPIVKNGSGTLTLSGADTFTGSTTINGGTLTAAAGSGNAALGTTSGVTVNSGGTLLLGASNQINNTAPVTLAGGTFAKGNFSEGSTSGAGVGLLTLTASGSTLDFGTGTVGALTFASLSPGAFTLTINNWTGTVATQGGATSDRLIFNSDQSANLSSFAFTGYGPGAIEFNLGGGFYEIVPAVPVPEPSTWIAGVLAIAVVGSNFLRWRRNAAPVKSAA